MMQLSNRHLEILQHTIGADSYGRRSSDRNYFCAGATDEPYCKDLVDAGLAVRFERSCLPYFNITATEAGIEYVRKNSPAPPKLTRSQRRYQEFLDSDTGESFKEWLMCRALHGKGGER